mmetsp:Transcript_86126/g.230632  ORF Transcript_86126/g.230632 Transcript_86126/m.230632 type:complete len:340 (-) Transcript_86126:944-1963(-)
MLVRFVSWAAVAWQLDFPDHDCERAGEVPPPVVRGWLWANVRDALQPACSVSKRTAHLQCGASLPDWRALALGVLVGPQVPEDRIPDLLQSDIAANVRSAGGSASCPLGCLFLDALHMLLTLEYKLSDAYAALSVRFGQALQDIPFAVWVGSRWPVFALLNSANWGVVGAPAAYRCDGVALSVDWGRFRQVFENLHGSWWQKSIEFVYHPEVGQSMFTASKQCLYGVYMSNLIKLLWAMESESSAYAIYAPYVQWIFYESPHLLGASGWPFFAVLHHGTALRRHGFIVDYDASDLSSPFMWHGPYLQSLPPERHLALVSLQHSERKVRPLAISGSPCST